MGKNHSILGIASLSISGLLIIYFAVALLLTKPHDIFIPYRPTLLMCYASPFIFLMGLGLGIGGLIQKDRKKLFPILGLIFSILTFFILGLVLIASFGG